MILISLILILFSVVFTGVWFWFFKKETITSQGIYKKGMKAFKRKNYNKAKDLFSQSFALDANNEDAQYMLGSALFELGEHNNAKEYFENVLKTSPQKFSALFLLAQILQEQENYEEAESIYKKILEEKPKDYRSYLNLGIINYRKQDYAAALNLFTQAKKLSPKNAQVSFYITICKGEICSFEKEKEIKNIIKEYSKISGKKDLPKDFNLSFTKVCAKAGKMDKAFLMCKKTLRQDSENVEAYKLLGVMHLIKRNFPEAKNALSMALNLQPRNPEIYEILSYLLCQQEDACDRKKCREKYYEMIKKFV